MDVRIRIITIAGAVALLFFVLELVRRRKLKEEYSVLWVLTSVVVLVMAVWYDLLATITSAVGADVPSSTLFFFGLLFVVALLLHFSIRVSAMERRMTALIQEIGLMRVTAPEGQPEPEPEPTREHEPAALSAERFVAPEPAEPAGARRG